MQENRPAIKGVGKDGYPIMTHELQLPAGHPLPMFCECGAILSWVDLGVLEYHYPDKTQRVFICGQCGTYSVHYPARRQD